MEYITIKVKEIHTDHILGENCLEIGYRLFTLVEDVYSLNERYRVFIYENTRLDNNKNIITTRYCFLNRCSLELFKFLISIKGIGTKGAINIIFACGGSRRLLEILHEEDRSKILRLSKKYALPIFEAIKNPKNKEIIESIYSEVKYSNRTEALWILTQLKYDKERCIEVLEKLNERLKGEGYVNGIEDLKVEEIVKECIALLFAK